MTKENKMTQSIIRLALITMAILLIPFIAMQFTNEVVWTLSDFIITGILIFGTGLSYKLITQKYHSFQYRVAVGIACATGFLLIWMNLAVGIIGSENNPINILFFGVIVIGLTGTFISRFQPKGMSLALFSTALSQILVTVIALAGDFYDVEQNSLVEILSLNGFFTLMWLGSGILFWQSAEKFNSTEN